MPMAYAALPDSVDRTRSLHSLRICRSKFRHPRDLPGPHSYAARLT
jgi:hypothetical protein